MTADELFSGGSEVKIAPPQTEIYMKTSKRRAATSNLIDRSETNQINPQAAVKTGIIKRRKPRPIAGIAICSIQDPSRVKR